MSQVTGFNNSYKPITDMVWVRARLCKLQKGCTRLAAASDKVYQLLAHGSLRVLRLLPPLKLVAMIQLKVALNTKKSNQNYINRDFKIRHVLTASWMTSAVKYLFTLQSMCCMHIESRKERFYQLHRELACKEWKQWLTNLFPGS